MSCTMTMRPAAGGCSRVAAMCHDFLDSMKSDAGQPQGDELIRNCLFAVLIVAGAAPGAAAQLPAPLPKIDGHRIPLQVDSFAIYVIRGRDTIRTGWVRDEISSDGVNLTRVYASDDKVLGAQLDTIVDRLSDLAPVSYRSRSSDLVAQVHFDSLAASGWTRLINSDSSSLAVPLPRPVYDGTSFDLVARAGELAEGVTVNVPVFLVELRSTASFPGAVTGSESVDGHDCWVFRGDFGSLPVTFWIDKASRALRRQLMQFRADMGILFTGTPIVRPAPKRAV
jgi:hypothetical protein